MYHEYYKIMRMKVKKKLRIMKRRQMNQPLGMLSVKIQLRRGQGENDKEWNNCNRGLPEAAGGELTLVLEVGKRSSMLLVS